MRPWVQQKEEVWFGLKWSVFLAFRIGCCVRQKLIQGSYKECRHSPKTSVFPFHIWQVLSWLQLCSCPAVGSSTARSACMPLTLVKGKGSQIHSPPFSLAVDLGAIFIWAAGMDLLWLQAVKQQLGLASMCSKKARQENIWTYDWNFACKSLESGWSMSPPRYQRVVLMTWF